MRSSKLNRQLMDVAPQLRGCFEEVEAMWSGDEPSSHIVFGDCLGPALSRTLQSEAWATDAFLRAAFTFLEELLLLQDEYTDGVVVTSVLDHLGGTPVNERAREIAGERTLHFLDQWAEWQA